MGVAVNSFGGRNEEGFPNPGKTNDDSENLYRHSFHQNILIQILFKTDMFSANHSERQPLDCGRNTARHINHSQEKTHDQ
jgi:hypothetical protein